MIDTLLQFLKTLYDVEGIIAWGGLLLICAIIFTETGLFFGFFLPGDSLLITAGIFAASGHLNLAYLLIFASLCAVAGDQLNYYVGHKTGKMLYARKESFFFRRKHLEKAQAFYGKHGPKTIVIARFVPFVRTFAPAVAGAANMDYGRFVTYNIFGGILWVFSTVLGGYFLGRIVPDIEKYIHIIILGIIVASFVPIAVEYYRNKGQKKKEPA